MLKETLDEFKKAEASEDSQKNENNAIKLFHDFLALLKNSQQFPNPHINSLAGFVEHLLNDGHLSLVFYEKREMYGYLILYVETAEGLVIPRLYVPDNFIEEVVERPERQIGVIASLLSQCRDYFCGQFKKEKEKAMQNRSLAYEAEALNTLLDLADQEKVPLDLSHYQITILDKFPDGLADLDEEYWYPQPKYQKTFSPPAIHETYGISSN